MADLADRLRRQRYHARNVWRADPFGQLQQGHCPQHDPDLLHPAAQQLPQFLPVFDCDFNA